MDIPAEIGKFVRVNRLDERCEKVLRELENATARKVMGLAGGAHSFELSGDIRDPTAVVMARVRKAREGGGRPARRRASRSRSRR